MPAFVPKSSRPMERLEIQSTALGELDHLFTALAQSPRKPSFASSISPTALAQMLNCSSKTAAASARRIWWPRLIYSCRPGPLAARPRNSSIELASPGIEHQAIYCGLGDALVEPGRVRLKYPRKLLTQDRHGVHHLHSGIQNRFQQSAARSMTVIERTANMPGTAAACCGPKMEFDTACLDPQCKAGRSHRNSARRLCRNPPNRP